MLNPRKASAVLAGLLTACGSPERPGVNSPSRDASTTDLPLEATGGTIVDASSFCSSMNLNCDGTTPFTCDARGARVYQATCPSGRPFCAPGAGCVSCLPGATRCSPDAPDTPQRCDSSQGWLNETVCDTAGGQRCVEGRCGDPCDAPEGARQYLGCNYWATITPNSQLYPGFQFAVVVSNPNTFDVTVDVRRGGSMVTSEALPPGEVRTIPLPWVDQAVMFNRSNPGCTGTRDDANCRVFNSPGRSAVVRAAAYHIRSSAPVAAYQFNPLTFQARRPNGTTVYSFTNDASLLLSQRALTQRYIVLTAPNWTITSQAGTATTVGGFIAIAAVADKSTSVTVQLPQNHGVSAAVNNRLQYDNLMPGDVAIVVGDSPGDLSGAIVEASNSVAVFAGHDCTNMPQSRVACDHLEEQVLPLEVLGRDYIVSRLRDRDIGSIVRMVAPFDNTVVQFDPPSAAAPRRLRAREVFELPLNGSVRINSSRPLLVAQFMLGLGPVNEGDSQVGDPAMVQEVPIQQFRDRYDLLVPATYDRNFLNVVAPHGARVLVDGAALMGSVEQLGPWDIIHAEVRPGGHRVSTAEGVPLGVKVYGTARYTSYMYPGGLDLRLLPPG